jgi:hypothetical protein
MRACRAQPMPAAQMKSTVNTGIEIQKINLDRFASL